MPLQSKHVSYSSVVRLSDSRKHSFSGPTAPRDDDVLFDDIIGHPNGSYHEGALAYCCLPTGCSRRLSCPIVLNNLQDSVKVYCNNESCSESQWMHSACFHQWEDAVLHYLRSCSRARGWSGKQLCQNLWTKKGYDLAFKACNCRCGRGHLRLDQSYTAHSRYDDNRKPRKPKSREHQLSGERNLTQDSSACDFQQQRVHRNSVSSNESNCSPPNSAGTTPTASSGMFMLKDKFDFFANPEQASSGNIFRHRTDLMAFNSLPRSLQNPYHIKTEDEGPHGNDETRCFLLTNLSAQQVTHVRCVVCEADLPVYDKYPLVDGTFFLSPQQYNSDLQVASDHRMMYLNTICINCMDVNKVVIRCRGCRTQWFGSALVIGSMYSYDVFAAMPCCAGRLTCKQCRHPVLDPGSLKYFSEYSRKIQCPYCKVEDYHFTKSLDEMFTVQKRQPSRL